MPIANTLSGRTEELERLAVARCMREAYRCATSSMLSPMLRVVACSPSRVSRLSEALWAEYQAFARIWKAGGVS